ncbi:hypothetical protein RA29_19670 [Tateyamaria sp. ANG-S1]|nr:hypothetical protein RA29_19670 [Tateyamaria sp. ANG-S1]
MTVFLFYRNSCDNFGQVSLDSALRAYSDNYLIDTDHGVIVDVEATKSIRQAAVGSTKTMLKRVKQKFDLHPKVAGGCCPTAQQATLSSVRFRKAAVQNMRARQRAALGRTGRTQ